jgi:HemY protein
MKWLILLLLTLTTAVFFVLLARDDPGFVVLGWKTWTVEMSLAWFLLAVVVTGILTYGIIQFFWRLWQIPFRWWQRNAQLHQQKSHHALITGLLALLQQQWASAEQQLLKTVSTGEMAVLHYLGAAQAAAQQQAFERVAEYIAAICLTMPKNEVTFTLWQAQLQLQQQAFTQALVTTQQAYKLAPKQTEVLLLLATLYVQLADWQNLIAILPQLRKQKVFSSEQLQQLENQAHINLIQQTLRTQPTQAEQFWQKIPKTLRMRPSVVKAYVKPLIATAPEQAEPLIREALKHHWETELLLLYSQLATSHPMQTLNTAESWLKTHENDPILLITIGRLCLRNHLLEKAQHYLEASIHLMPTPEAFQTLGDLLSQQGEYKTANEYYRQGIGLR